ncbi:hypothetical protein OG413_39395 [Streptomyces sp. NBC_01433]|nr:hypothetical protein [Streptomyces sp. NBC_01433]MCX4681266.1 hypothetical protein [Streptomyces sp. NBC_01433]
MTFRLRPATVLFGAAAAIPPSAGAASAADEDDPARASIVEAQPDEAL